MPYPSYARPLWTRASQTASLAGVSSPSEIAGFALLGAAGGLAAGLVVALVASRLLDQKLSEGSSTLTERLGSGREELEAAFAEGRRDLERLVSERVRTEVPPVVRREVEASLSSYGLTPDTGRQIARVLSYAERAGLLGLRSGSALRSSYRVLA